MLILLWRLLVKALSPFGVLELATFYKRDLTAPLVPVPNKFNLAIGEATTADVPCLLRLLLGPLTLTARGSEVERDIRDLLHERFRRGWKCYVATYYGEIVHCTWLAIDWAESIDGRVILLNTDEAYTADSYTAEAWRGNKIHPLVKDHIFRHLKENGIRTAYALVNADRRSSRRVQQFLGYRSTGTVLYFSPHSPSRTWVWAIRPTSLQFLEEESPTFPGWNPLLERRQGTYSKRYSSLSKFSQAGHST
jgi:hypothetical protein